MFDHIEFSVSDIAAARGFYGPIIVAIGETEVFFDEGENPSVLEPPKLCICY